MFALSRNVCEIFANQEKMSQTFTMNKGQAQGVEKWDLRHSTNNVRIQMGEFFKIVATWEHTFMQKATRTHTHTRTQTRTHMHGHHTHPHTPPLYMSGVV